MATTMNGNGQPTPQPTARRCHPMVARFSEIAAAASVPGCIFVLALGLESWLLLLFLISLLTLTGVGAYKLAISCAVFAARKEQGKRDELKYQVTMSRLEILKEVGVPDDVRRAVSYLLWQPPLPEDTFLNKIACDPNADLGLERTNQFKEKILRYTMVDRKVDSVPAAVKLVVAEGVTK
jgi:hypothetical protein